jgi:hypothetical protein
MPLIAWLGSAFTTLLASWKAWFLLFMATSIGPFIIKLLLGFGVGYVTYELGSFALNELFNDFKSSLSGLPGDLLTFVSIAKMDSAIGILLGGLAARLALAGFTSATSATGKKRSMVLGGDE